MNIDHIKQQLDRFETVSFVGPVAESTILAAEGLLGVRFPTQYREFLTSLGCGSVDSEEFIGLGGAEHLDVAKLALRLRSRNRPLPSHLLPLRGDGFGNYDCLDTRLPGEPGELTVVHWHHEGGNEQDCETLALSYYVWFESILTLVGWNES